DSNRCKRFCRPLPSHSATAPYSSVHGVRITHNPCSLQQTYSDFSSPPSRGPDIFSFRALRASRSPNVDFSVCWFMFSIALLFEGVFFLPVPEPLSSSVDHVCLCESTIRRSSLENSSTLKSRDSPTSTFWLLSCFCRFLAAQKPSIP